MKYYEVHQGQNRLVVAFPDLGFVVKFPKIHISNIWFFFEMIRAVWKYDRSKFRQFLIDNLEIDALGMPTIMWCLFKGITDNAREMLFFFETRHSFVLPTLFSFFGLVNIQQYGPDCNVEGFKIGNRISELTNGANQGDGHHFLKNKNFSMVNGCLKMRDYGSKKSQAVIRKLDTCLKLRQKDFE